MSNAKYVGRAGALAVALGIGTVVTATPWIAVAEPLADTSNESASTADSNPTSPVDSSDEADPPGDTPVASDDRAVEAANEDTETAETPEDSAKFEESEELEKSEEFEEFGSPDDPDDSEPSAPELPSVSESPSASAGSDDQDPVVKTLAAFDLTRDPPAVTVRDDEASPAPVMVATADSTMVSTPRAPVTLSPVQASVVETQPVPDQPAVRPVQSPVTALVSGLLGWVGLGPLLSGGPTAPAQPPLLWGLLEWVRRQVQHTLFNRTPTVAYDPAENSYSQDGVITGDLRAVDPDGDPLAFTVTQAPEHGTVVVNRDGTFTYTPDADFARIGSDTFSIEIDDAVTYQLPGPAGVALSALHRGAQLIGLAGSDTIDSHPTVKVAPHVIAIIPLGESPYRIAASPDGARMYVTNLGDGTVSVIDTATNTVTTTITVGNSPAGVAVSPDGTTAYVTNASDGTVSVIDTATHTVTNTTVVNGPVDVAVSPEGATAYVVTNTNGPDALSVVDTATNSVTATITVGNDPVGVAVSPDGATVYVTNADDATVSVIDTATNTVTATISVGPGSARDVAVSPDGASVYVTNTASGIVSVIDTATNTVIAAIAVGDHPSRVAVSPDGATAYATNGNGTVSVIKTATNAVIATVTVGDSPYDVAVTPDGGFAYVTNIADDTVSVIQL